MTPHIVVDVGNSRVKWGRCDPGAVVEATSLPHGQPEAWQRQLEQWGLAGPLRWVVSGVHPGTCAQLLEWIHARGDAAHVLEFARQLPLEVSLARPDQVGIDRLLNAVAVNRRRRPGAPAVAVDAGSAVTVDYVDLSGAFRGGAIFPGLRLMAQSLHEYTALLPLIEVRRPLAPFPGDSTTTAMEAGIYWAVAGGIRALVTNLAAQLGTAPEVFLGGGDASLLLPALKDLAIPWPLMTLEGIRLTAEVLP